MKHKPFDCVEMMHAGQDAVKKRLNGLTREEILAYWHRRTAQLKKEQERLRVATSAEHDGNY